MAYSEKVPTMSAIRDVRTFDKQEPGVGTGIVGVGAPDCGDAFPPLGQFNFFWHIAAPHRVQTYCPVKSPSSVVCNTRTRWSQYMLPAFSQDARSILAVSGVIVDSARLHRPCRVVQRLALSRS
jgi:hypothetical protein